MMLIGKSTTVQIATPKPESQPKVMCSTTGAFDVSVRGQHTEFQSEECVHDVTITAMKVGEYEFNIEVDGSQLYEQPYTINVLDPTKCRLETNIPQKMQKQESKEITVKTTGAGKAELTVVSSNPLALHTELEQTHTDAYQVMLIPIEVTSAAVRVDLQYGGISLPRSPFTVDVFDIHQVVIEPSDSPVTYTNEPFPITVYTQGAGEGVLEVRHTGPQTFKAEVTKSKNGAYTISCTPLQVGTHSLSLYWNDLELPTSPITFQSCDPSRCAVRVAMDYKEAGNGITTGLYCKTNNAFKVTVDGLSEHNVKYFTMAVIPPQGTSPLIQFNQGRDGMATAFFTPTMTGEYLVNASLAGEPVKNSPLKVLAVTPSACRLERSIPHYLALLHEMKIEIDTSDAGPGELTCTCHTLGDMSAAEDCIALSTHDTHLKMKGIAIGKSSISLKWAGYDILSIPYEVTVVDPQQCTFKFMPAKGDIVRENTEVTVHINATAACDCTPEVRLEGPHKKQVAVSIHQNEQGHFSASFHASTCGPHTLRVLVAEVDVKGSPLSFTVQPQEAEIIGTLPTMMLIGKSTTVQIATPKPESQPKVMCSTTGAFDVSVRGQHTEFQSEECVHDVTITAMKVGEYEFNIEVDGSQLYEQPYTINVLDPTKCRLETNIPQKMQKQESKEITVKTTGAGKAELTVVSSNPLALHTELEQTHTDAYQVMLIPIEVTSAAVRVDLQYGGISLPQSPFTVDVFDIHQVVIEPSDSPVTYTSEPFPITVYTQGAGEGVLEVRHTGPQTFKAEVTKSKNGAYTISCTPLQVGTHSLSLYWNDLELPTSPITFQSCDPSRCAVRVAMDYKEAGNGITTGLYCKTNNAFKVTVDGLSEHNVKYFTMAVIPPQGTSPLIQFNQGRDGMATAFFTPTMTGEYLVNASLAGEPVKNSPLKVLAVTPSACRLERSIPHYLALLHEMKIEIDTSDAGPGELTCTCHTLGDMSAAEDCIALSTHDTHLKMKGIAIGKSSISLKWAGYDILSIPYEVTVVDPQQCTFKFMPAKGDIVRENTEVTVHINATAACDCTPEVRLEGPHKKQVAVSIHQNEQGHFSASFHASTCGPHTLRVLVADVDVKGSPLSFTVQPQEAEIIGTLPTMMLIGKSTTVQIATPKPESQPKVMCSTTGAFDVSVRGQHTEFQSEECVHDVTITAMKVGEYEFNIEVDGSQLYEQPYTINVLDPTKCRLETNIPQKMQKQESKEITVKTTGAGKAELTVVSSNPLALHTELEQTHTDAYQVTLIPIEVTSAAVRVDLQYGGISLPQSPFTVDIFDIHQVVIEPSDSPVTYTSEPFPITVYTQGAGEGVLEVRHTGPQTFKAEVTKSKNGVYTISCTPLQVGTHSLSLYWNDLELPTSPITFQSCDPSRCVVRGLPFDGSMVTQRKIEVAVDYKEAGNGIITAEVEYGDKSTEQLPVRPGRNTAFFTVSPVTMGETKFRMTFNGKELLTRKWVFKEAKHLSRRCVYVILLAVLVAIVSLSCYYFMLCNDCTLSSTEKPL